MDKELASIKKRWAYAAAAWAFLFAAMSFYWALGGKLGGDTLGNVFTDPATLNDPAFIAFLWVTAFLKLAAAFIALSLVQRWGNIVPRRLRLILAWGLGLFFLLYGGALFIQHGLMALGVIPVPASLGSLTVARWHFLFWDPFWALGGLLFILAARSLGR